MWALTNLTRSQPPLPVDAMISCLTSICKNTFVNDAGRRNDSWASLDYHSWHDVPERSLYIDLMVELDVFTRWIEILPQYRGHSTSTVTTLCNVLDFGSRSSVQKVMNAANRIALIIADCEMNLNTHRRITKQKAVKRLGVSLVRLVIMLIPQ